MPTDPSAPGSQGTGTGAEPNRAGPGRSSRAPRPQGPRYVPPGRLPARGPHSAGRGAGRPGGSLTLLQGLQRGAVAHQILLLAVARIRRRHLGSTAAREGQGGATGGGGAGAGAGAGPASPRPAPPHRRGQVVGAGPGRSRSPQSHSGVSARLFSAEAAGTGKSVGKGRKGCSVVCPDRRAEMPLGVSGN